MTFIHVHAKSCAPLRGADHLLDIIIARKISPIIRIGVSAIPGIHGKPQGNPHGKPQGKPQGNPMILVKPEKIVAQINKAKSIPNIGDTSSKRPR
jgi:hypothetical protein